jgi:ribonuclease P protein component
MSLRRIRGTVTAGVPEASNQGVERRTAKSFPRSGRLLRHADFERVYKQGRRHFSASMTVFYLLRQESKANAEIASGLRVGFTVGRALGGAVQRNRMKRRLREAVRLTRPVPGPNADVVINPKKVLLSTDFEVVMNEVRQAFVVIEKKLSGKTPGEANIDTKGSGSRKPEA